MAQLFLMIVSVASAATAYAQAPGPPPPPPADAPPPPAYPPPAPMAAPPPPAAYPPPPPAVESAASDLDPSVRRFAIGYAGISQVPVGINGPGSDITIPALGLRYWTSPTMGVDIAVGFGWSGGSQEAAGTSTDKDSIFGFVLQAGLPFALSTHRHVSFQVIPFAAIAHGQSTLNSGTTYSTDVSGLRVDVGARAGFEVFFGFIGMPELALSATIGAQFRMTKYSAEQAGLSQSDTTLLFVTTVENNPWDFFAGNVAARYYF